MAIAVARRLTTPTKETPPVDPPDARPAGGAETHRHGPSAQRADGVTGEPGAQVRRTPGAARGARADRQAGPPAHHPLAAGDVATACQPGGYRLSAPAGTRESPPAAPGLRSLEPRAAPWAHHGPDGQWDNLAQRCVGPPGLSCRGHRPVPTIATPAPGAPDGQGRWT